MSNFSSVVALFFCGIASGVLGAGVLGWSAWRRKGESVGFLAISVFLIALGAGWVFFGCSFSMALWGCPWRWLCGLGACGACASIPPSANPSTMTPTITAGYTLLNWDTALSISDDAALYGGGVSILRDTRNTQKDANTSMPTPISTSQAPQSRRPSNASPTATMKPPTMENTSSPANMRFQRFLILSVAIVLTLCKLVALYLEKRDGIESRWK